ncbi:MAG: LON peptidase substrate-binding domain-containing protein [Planctomycetota bacterium]
MSFQEADLSMPGDFSGKVRLFPLPNLVLFPGVMQGLHIFEPRYRDMMQDALASDDLIAMASLKPGWEAGSPDSEPAVFETVCVGKIVTHNQLPDGRFNLLLLGARRAKIVEEFESDELYRTAHVQIIEDTCSATAEELDGLKSRLVDVFRKFITVHPGFGKATLSESIVELPAGMMADLICYSSGLETEHRIHVLEMADVAHRVQAVLTLLEQRNNLAQNFPPDFSLN